MALVLDTSAVAASDRVDVVRAAMASSVVPSRVHVDAHGDEVRARILGWELGAGARMVHVASSGHRLTRTARHLRGGAPEYVSLAVQLRGHGTLTHRDLPAGLQPGALQLVDLTSPFDFVSGQNSSAVAFYADLAVLGLPVDVVRRAAPRIAASPLHELTGQHLCHVRQVADHVEGTHAATMLGSATMALVRALIADAAESGRRRRLLGDELFARITTYMRCHLGDTDLDPARIAAAHHISVRYLHLLFARHDLTVRGWLVRERLEGARLALAADASRHTSISAIARQWGFADPGHFARRFRNAYDMSPRTWQQRCHHDDVDSPGSSGRRAVGGT